MNILVVTSIELDERNACGNTFANWLSDWSETNVYNIYGRVSLPNNGFCKAHFQISPTSLLRYIFRPKKIGKLIEQSSFCNNTSNSFEQHFIKKNKKSPNDFYYLAVDTLYSMCLWQNKRYQQFIQNCNLDIVFYFAKSEAIIYQNLKYLKKHTNAKLVAFYADDMYSMYKESRMLSRKIYKHRFEKLVKLADLNYGASTMMCEEYEKLFGLKMSPLYKGCNISESKDRINEVVRIVYAGNLYYGRDKVLGEIAVAIKLANVDFQKACLEIYTTTAITPEIDKILNIEGSSKIMGARPFDEIVEIQRQSDIVLHVESFLPENMKVVRLSYSTKMSDCLQSGSMMMVVGPRGIASVEEALSIDGVFVIDNENKINDSISDLLSNKNLIIEGANRTNAIAKQIFPITKVRER